MPKYKQTSVTAKQGINFVRSTVESAGSLFIKIEQENDLGIDAILEFIDGEEPLNKQVAAQIKSGQSYYDAEAGECLIPIGSHRQYWAQHPLPVYGIVYVPTLSAAHWIDVKHYLAADPEASVIRFQASKANRFDESSFNRIFVPRITGRTPAISIEEALALTRSRKEDERYLALLVLFRRFPNVLPVWDELVSYFIEEPVELIPPVLIYWLAHIPWHGDICGYGEPLTDETRAYVKALFTQFQNKQIVKLLSFIDEESGLSRGSIGQSVEAVVSCIPQSGMQLRQIIRETKLSLPIRENAALILAMNEGSNALEDLDNFPEPKSWYVPEIVNHVRTFGKINPYG